MKVTSLADAIAHQFRRRFLSIRQSEAVQSAKMFLNSVVDYFAQQQAQQDQARQSKTLRFEMFEARCVLSGADWYPEASGDGDDDSLVGDANIPVYVDGNFEFGDLTAQFPYGQSNTFKLASNPSATKVIYLDYDGHHSVGNWWNHDIVFPSFDTNGDTSSFSNAELSQIQKQFLHVAEDFLPFDVNVTTIDPGVEALRKSGPGDQFWGVRSLNTQYTDGFGNGTGGIAHLNSFDAGIDDPVFTFNKGANAGGMTNSHEVGHSLGLRHDGLGAQSYHPGTGSGETGWGPIMGAPFGKNLVQWSKGEYADSTNTEDDLQIITRNRNGFGFRADDHGNGLADATPLDVDQDFNVSQWGIIERNTDRDYFSFSSGAGEISIDIDALTVNPSLDVEAKLFDSSGNLLQTSNPAGSVGSTLSLEVGGGTYFISVDGVGKSGVYTDYGSLGFYEISGVVLDPINDPPTLDEIPDMEIDEDDPEQFVGLDGITAGFNEFQPLRVTAVSSNSSLIANPVVEYTSPDQMGDLSFTPVPNQNGVTVITVTVEDGGLDLDLATTSDNASFSRSFDVVVNPVNDPPTLDPLSDMTIEEDAGQQVIDLTGIGDGDEGFQPLRVTANSSNPGLIPIPGVEYQSPQSQGVLRFTPADNQFGSSVITVTVEDGGSDRNLATAFDNLTFDRTFLVQVEAVNDKPTLDAIPNQVLDEDESRALDFSGVTAGGGEIQPLRVTVTSTNLAVMGHPEVDYSSDDSSGVIHLVPEPGMAGSTLISVLVEDGGFDGNLATENDNQTFVRVFAVDVNSVNDTPTLDDISDVELMEDEDEQTIGLTGITAGSMEGSQPLQVTAESSNPDLLASLSVDYNSPYQFGDLVFKTLENAFGETEITVTVEDGGLDENLATQGDNATFSRTFLIMVDPVNDAPRFQVPRLVETDQSSGLGEIQIKSIDSGPFETGPLRFSVTTDNPEFVRDLAVDYTDPNSTGRVTFDTAQQLGRGKIFLTLEDGGLDGSLATSYDNLTTTKVIDLLVTTKTVSFAHTDRTIHGLVEGAFDDTYWINRSSQKITESGFGQGSRSRLEHHWKVDLPGDHESAEFFIYAGHNASNEQFRFQYQVGGTGKWKNLVTTNQNGYRKYYSRVVDADMGMGDFIWIRARDTHRGDDAELATLDVRKIFLMTRGLEDLSPTVNAFAFDKVGSESGSDKAQIRFQLADRTRLDHDVEVHYEIGGTAENGDYREVFTGTKTIKAGNLAARLFITPRDDRAIEGNESLTVRVLPSGEDYRVSGSPVAAVKIVDNDLNTFEAEAEVSYLGRHEVNYGQSQFVDGQAEIISERPYGTKTMMDHQWRFDLTGQTNVVFKGKFEVMSDAYVDRFDVAYSTDQLNWNFLGRLRRLGSTDFSQSVSLNPGTSDVWVRLADRYRRPHDTHVAQVAVRQLQFVSANVAGPGSPAPAYMGAMESPMATLNGTKAPTVLSTASTAGLVGHQDPLAFTGEAGDEFTLPEFYVNRETAEIDSVFEDWDA